MTITVPKARIPSGELRPVTQARVTTSAPRGAFDSGIPQIAEAAAGIFLDEKKKADTTAFLEADLKAAKAAAELTTKYKTNYQGKDAAGAAKDADDEYAAYLAEISGGLSETQKGMFAHSANSRRSALFTGMEHHSAGEIQKYTNQVTETYIGQAKSDAAVSANLYNPGDVMGTSMADEGIALSIKRQQAAILTHAQNNGMGDLWAVEKSKELASKTHRSVVEVMLSKGNDLMAKDYFELHKDEIVGAEDITKLNGMLRHGNVIGESQRQHDKIVATMGTWEKGNEMAAAIADPEVRKATIGLLDESFGRKKRFDNERRDNNFLTAAITAEKAGTTRAIEPAVWEEMSPNERTTIEQRIKHSKEGTEPANNSKVWTEFMFKNPQELMKLTDADMMRIYRPVLDNAHYDNALRQVTAVREAMAKGDTAHLSAMQTDKETVNNAYLGYRKKNSFSDLNGSEREELMRFSDASAVAVQRFEQAKGRKATDEEKQVEVRKVLAKEVFINKWGTDPKVPTAVVSEDDKKRAYVPMEQIPPNRKTGLVNWARSLGIIPLNASQAEAEVFLNDRLERADAAGQLGSSDDVVIQILNDGPKLIRKSK